MSSSAAPLFRDAAASATPPRPVAPARTWVEPSLPRDPDGEAASDEIFRAMDLMAEASLARLSSGLSPAALTLAMTDWAIHLATAPGKQAELATRAWRKAFRLGAYMAASAAGGDAQPAIVPPKADHRFDHPGWRGFPYDVAEQGFLLTQEWWRAATRGVPGVSRHSEDVVAFMARQWLDVFSPSNNPFLNPQVMARAGETGGANFELGWRNFVDDATRAINKAAPEGAEKFRPGHEVATTPGEVILRNRLIELIQYAPQTPTVLAEPILIVPAWIMKYYILDLSAQNSLIRFLVDKGHTVFCISWLNPTEKDADLSLDDYRTQGVMAALDAIAAVLPGRGVHAAGYCLGGTLLATAAAAMARAGDTRLASITLLAAQTDFTEPGELGLFIDDSQLRMLESMMWSRGYLSDDQMAGAFQMLRTNDLVWSRLSNDYMLGDRHPMNDLMAWNADSTRMPYRMHAEYLRSFYLDNALSAGRICVEGHPVALANIHVPIFAVGTESDHVAPWRSVYKIARLADSEVTFVLTNGGHNAGIVSEPGHKGRRYRIAAKPHGAPILGPDEWAAQAATRQGSWWSEWSEWLAARSAKKRGAPPPMGAPAQGYAPLCDAPGRYVLG
jgi:polyhydroxyalkanoate synthase